jgi:Cys-tRNA(Pro)/Cys-tRNA(Cys) deacylase
MPTRAIRFLSTLAVAFEVITYHHLEKGARFAAQATGIDLAQTIKTLVVVGDESRHVLALMPGDRRLSVRRLAQVLGVKRAAMADAASAERLTGYKVGGISPFGLRRSLPVVMEADVLRHPFVLINAGRRGTMLRLAPTDIARILDALVATIAA